MSISLTFRIRFKSDFHVGSGRRGGPDIDSALLRDHEHAPLLRGTMLVGLLKDGLRELGEFPVMSGIRAETIVKTRDNSKVTAAERLFGSTRLPKRWTFSSAQLADDVSGRALTDWGAQAVSRVRISPRTGRAETGKLFREEEGDKRLEYIFTATCPTDLVPDEQDAVLLVAAARMVRSIGAARRRGRGECEIFLQSAEGLKGLKQEQTEAIALTEQALNLFRTQWLEDFHQDESEPPKKPQSDNEIVVQTDLAQAKRFRIYARLEEPVIVARRSETANAFDGLSFIPGVTVLGALAERAASHLGLNAHFASAQPDAKYLELFFRGGVRVTGLLPAQIVKDELYPVIPAPLALFTCENFPAYDSHLIERHPVHNALVDGDPQLCTECQVKQKPISGFLSLEPSPVSVSMKRREEAHIQMNSDTGRTQSGALYEYIGLEAGQFLMGELECATPETFQQLSDWTGLKRTEQVDESLELYEFSELIRFGKAARRGYGKTKLILEAIPAEKPLTWIGQNIEERVTDVGKPLSITLLTPAIVSDEFGRFYASFDEKWLAKMLGVKPEHIEMNSNFARSSSVDAFNGYRRLPRWRDEALTEGSAAAFSITPDGLETLKSEPKAEDALATLHNKLRELEQRGIGLRRAEGFGRIAFNHPIYNPATMQGEDGNASGFKFRFGEESGEPPLQAEVRLLEVWASELDGISFQGVTSGFENVARALYLNQHKTVSEMIKGLDAFVKPNPNYLWGKELSNRAQKEKLDAGGINQLKQLVTKWEKDSAGNKTLRARGIAILADWVSDKVEVAKVKEGTK